jgi:hypothetical protein
LQITARDFLEELLLVAEIDWLFPPSIKSKITRNCYSRKLQIFAMTLREEEKKAISSGQGQIVDDSDGDRGSQQGGEVRICPRAVGCRLAGRVNDRSINGHFLPFMSSSRVRACRVMLQTLGS